MAVNNQKGMAILETLPMIFIFIMILSYGIGLWGVVHTAVVGSMGARTYAFKTLNHRTNVMYFSDKGTSKNRFQYKELGFRLHSIFTDEAEYSDGAGHLATQRPISIGDSMTVPRRGQGAGESEHNEKIHEQDPNRRSNIQVDPVWVQISYGICVTVACGDE